MTRMMRMGDYSKSKRKRNVCSCRQLVFINSQSASYLLFGLITQSTEISGTTLNSFGFLNSRVALSTDKQVLLLISISDLSLFILTRSSRLKANRKNRNISKIISLVFNTSVAHRMQIVSKSCDCRECHFGFERLTIGQCGTILTL